MNAIQSIAQRLGSIVLAPARSAPFVREQPRHRDEAARSAYQAFLADYPGYAGTQVLDALRETEYRRLDAGGHVYLDYTGGGLYPESLLREHMTLLSDGVFGNPHSKNPTSLAMTDLVERARAKVLRYFNADPDEYTAIFTPNATGALRLVAEAYPFSAGGRYLLTADNHNSVNGIREMARAKGAPVNYVQLMRDDMRIHDATVIDELSHAQPGAHNLFAYPAQSNFSGVQHPLEWIEEAQRRGWDVLLDAAAFAPANRFDLGVWHPDFVDLSFYKMFGYPTGVGCLLARKTALAKLVRPWYSGGTIAFSSVLGDGHHLMPGYAAFEDGTVNYLSLPAIESGLRLMASIGIDVIHTRVMCLTGWLIDQLTALRHSTGQPVVHLYGPANTHRRGGAVQVNFFDPRGRMWDCLEVERLANAERISLRAGCHCNPGAREAALGLSAAELTPCFKDKAGMSHEQVLRAIAGKTAGAVRTSVGLASNFADVQAYARFAAGFVDRGIEAAHGSRAPHLAKAY